MTVIDILTIITFVVDIFAAGFAVGRYIEKHRNDRHSIK